MKRFVSVALSILLIFCCNITAFAGERSVLNINKSGISHSVSENLYGISMEDLDGSLDGGLVSELVNNGSFEYTDPVCPAWELNNAVTISTNDSMNSNNPQYAIVHCDNKAIIRNTGFGEMGFNENTKYAFSCFVRNINFEGSISVFLDSKSNSKNYIHISNGDISSSKWSALHASLKSSATESGSLGICFEGSGDIMIDMVSLVPQDSYGYGSANEEWKYTSLRQDLFDSLKVLKPAFIRFPGGCLVEGRGLDDPYSWKDTIGPLDSRRQHKSVYDDASNEKYMLNTSAMGYHEYFQLCEDLGAMPIPVVGEGISCQRLNQYDKYTDAFNKLNMTDEQWQAYLVYERGFSEGDRSAMSDYTDSIMALGINSREDYEAYLSRIAFDEDSNEFSNYLQDILDLIEYANGDSITSYWGALRSANGHEQPFNIKYLAIQSDAFGGMIESNLPAIQKAIKKKYPKITLICSSPMQVSTKYILDEKYNFDEKMMIESNNSFDGIDRESKGIMISEYCCDGWDVGSAIGEASLMTAIERNSDIVKFAAFSPVMLKGDSGAMIMLDSFDTAYTPSYFTQMIFSNNIGKNYVDTQNIDDDIFQSVTVDENSQMLYVKLVNTSKSKKSISINASDFGDVNMVSKISVGDKFADSKNTIGKQAVAPQVDEINTDSSIFDVTLGGNSASVIRIAYGENDGTALWSIPDTVDTTTSFYVPKSARVLMIVLVLGFVIGSAIGFFVYRIAKKRSRNTDV